MVVHYSTRVIDASQMPDRWLAPAPY